MTMHSWFDGIVIGGLTSKLYAWDQWQFWAIIFAWALVSGILEIHDKKSAK